MSVQLPFKGPDNSFGNKFLASPFFIKNTSTCQHLKQENNKGKRISESEANTFHPLVLGRQPIFSLQTPVL